MPGAPLLFPLLLLLLLPPLLLLLTVRLSGALGSDLPGSLPRLPLLLLLLVLRMRSAVLGGAQPPTEAECAACTASTAAPTAADEVSPSC